jgi:hypothetical protein
MDKGRFLIETHLKTGRPMAELAKAHGVSRGWLYKLLAALPAGRSRRARAAFEAPQISPTRIADLYEDEIVAIRKGADRRWLRRRGRDDPLPHGHARAQRAVVSTIWRVLKARGFVTPSPTSGRRAAGPASWPSSPTNAGRPT